MIGKILILLIAIQAGLLVHYNPLLFGRKVSVSSSSTRSSSGESNNNNKAKNADVASFHVYTEHPVLDQHLTALQLAAQIPESDFVAYRNHCLRVLSFAVYHLGQQTAAAAAAAADEEKNNLLFPTIQDINVMALALAYHDVGLWSDGGALDYLEPSVEQLEKSVKQAAAAADDDDDDSNTSSKKPVLQWSERDLATAREIILQHHKLTEWKPSTTTTTTTADNDDSSSLLLLVNARLVNHVRRADWADATMGLIRFGLPATHLQLAYEKLPDAGFHAMLAGFGARLSPNSFLGRLQVLKIFKW